MAQRDVRKSLPNGFDPARLGEADRPENDWGEPEKGAVHGANHTRRGEEGPEARFQGRKTRTATKDKISRRA
jgi:hypothetical protein